MKIMLFTFSVVSLLTAVSCGSNVSPPSNAEIVGTYKGHYGGGVETFEINADSSFTQTFRIVTNVVYTASGKWKFSDDRIHFEPFMSPDAILSGTPDGQPDHHPRSFGTWHRKPIRIELGEWPYNIVKVKDEGATERPLDED